MRGLTIAWFALVCGCTDIIDHGARVALTLTPSCSTTPATASSWRIRVVTDGGSDDSVSAALPSSIVVPPDVDVKVVVEALDPQGAVIARGSSRHVMIPGGAGFDAGMLTASVAPVGQFTPFCSKLLTARAGHTTTQLFDGQLLVAGGVGADGRALSSIEAIAAGDAAQPRKPIGIRAQGTEFLLPRAFHSATLGPSGQLWLVGGELPMPGGATSLVSTVLLYDATVDDFGALGPSTPPWPARARQLAFASRTHLHLFGGITKTGSDLEPSTQLDRIDFTTNRFIGPATLPIARGEAAMAMIGNDALLAGGLENASASTGTIFVNVDPASAPIAQGTLLSARAAATAVRLGSRALVAGGVGAGSTFLDTTEWAARNAPAQLGPIVSPRSKACGVTLDDHRALLFGGVGPRGSSDVAEIVHEDGTVLTLPFPGMGRDDMSCTLLDDGSVLIAGGRHNGAVLDDAWLLVPPNPR